VRMRRIIDAVAATLARSGKSLGVVELNGIEPMTS
jgi:hypothetical protein